MAATLSPVMPTTFKFCSGQFLGLVLVCHLAAKTCKLVKLRAERLQLGLVHAAVHGEEEQQHVVLREALAVEDPLRSEERWPHLFLCHSKVSAWVAISLFLPGLELEISMSLLVIDFDFWSDILILKSFDTSW